VRRSVRLPVHLYLQLLAGCSQGACFLLLLGPASSSGGRLDPAISDPAWPGGAFPPLPSSWTTWDLRASTAGFFLGNTSGQNDTAESARETSLGVVGLGWQLGLRDGAAWAVNGGLESRQREAARLLKASGSAVKVMVSAELDCTSPQWEASAAAIRNRSLARRVFMHHPNGSLWLDHKWGGLFTQPWYNWSSPTAVRWWIDEGPIAEAMRDPNIDGVYLGVYTVAAVGNMVRPSDDIINRLSRQHVCCVF
jgi:hypothetical protein